MGAQVVLANNFHLGGQRLGLFSDSPDRIHGVLDRIPVAICAGYPFAVVYSAILPRGAPVSFNLAEKNFADKASDFFRGLVGTPTGHDAFDERFVVHATDAAYVLSLLDGDARAVLERLAKNHLQPLLTAQMLSIGHFQTGDSVDRVESDLRELVSAAHILGRSFAQPGIGYR